MPTAAKSELEVKREYLNGLGIKAKDLAQGNVNRMYAEMLEYQKSGKIPEYLL